MDTFKIVALITLASGLMFASANIDQQNHAEFYWDTFPRYIHCFMQMKYTVTDLNGGPHPFQGTETSSSLSLELKQILA